MESTTMLHHFLKEDLRVLGLKFCKVGSRSDGMAFNGSIKGCLTCNFIHMADSHLTPLPFASFPYFAVCTCLGRCAYLKTRVFMGKNYTSK